jgi:anti-anti-sigma regulatory factor
VISPENNPDGTNTKPASSASAGEHLCVVFDSDLKRDEVVSAFVREGLSRNERIFCFTDGRDPNDVLRTWSQRGIDVDRARDRSQLTIATTRESYLASGVFDPDALIGGWGKMAKGARHDGFSGVRVIGAMEWATRSIPGAEHLRSYEERIQREVFPAYPITGLCEFDLRYFNAADAEWIVRLHPDGDLQPDPLWKDRHTTMEWTFHPAGVKVAGIVDVFSEPGFNEALELMSRRTEGDVTLDLGGVPYLDVRAMVAIARAANKLWPQRHLIVRDASAVVQRSMNILHLSNIPGLRLVPLA